MASEPTEIMATDASPLTFAFCPARSSRTAQAIVTGRVRRKLFDSFSAAAMAAMLYGSEMAAALTGLIYLFIG